MNPLPIQTETSPTLPIVNSFDGVITQLSQSVGISYAAAANLLAQALKSSVPIGNKVPAPEWDYISAMLSSFNPKNIQEAMLSIQMVGAHYQATELFSKAAKYDSIDIKEQYLKMALKMSRLFASQLETLKKIRSKGIQKMIVEHVTVQSGGQAIVGQISSDKV